MRLRLLLRLAPVLALLLTLPSCGYALSKSTSPSRLRSLGISRIYVRPVRNQTLRPAVENAVYSQLVRMVGSTPGLRAVNSPELADAELDGSVTVADRSVSGEIKASDLNPKQIGSSQLLVASEYVATLSCRLALVRTGSKPSVWSGEFSRSRPFPANSQVGALGSTGALINESEFERALSEIAADMMGDVRSSLTQDF